MIQPYATFGPLFPCGCVTTLKLIAEWGSALLRTVRQILRDLSKEVGFGFTYTHGHTGNATAFYWENLNGRGDLRYSGSRWKGNIELELNGMRYEEVFWVPEVRDGDHWGASFWEHCKICPVKCKHFFTVRFPAGTRDFVFSETSRPALGLVQPSVQWTWRVKWQGLETDHSPACNAEVKIAWSYTSVPLYILLGRTWTTFICFYLSDSQVLEKDSGSRSWNSWIQFLKILGLNLVCFHMNFYVHFWVRSGL